MKNLAIVLAAALLAPSAWAEDKAPAKAPAMELNKMGPASRKPKDEKAVKKEIEAFLKACDESAKKHDQTAMLAAIDFPVTMATDDSKGTTLIKAYSNEEYVAMMKPFYENMPKDMTMTNKYTVYVLSDAMADVHNDFTMAVGKQKAAGRSDGLVVKKDGKWMWKIMTEAGWGDSMTAPAAAPAAAPATP